MPKRRILWIMIALGLLGLLVSCGEKSEANNMDSDAGNIDNKAAYQKITAAEAKEMMTEEGVIILDVRTREEYEQGHIEQAVLLPYDEIEELFDELLPDKEAKILVYCRSGNRSQTAAKSLLELGYTNVYDFGGIIDWPDELVKD